MLRHLNAGTKYTPPVLSTDAASDSNSDAERMIPKLSLSHCTAEPAAAMDPSRA